ncbi:23907_t:CDS:2 [Dentiscutata erythropus]|uniref:23907_t:CDS:1 n=1 Tax=Dentiscutata erythropus TaxID=1348616 RepID=A0A9N9EUL9_9GLOM|nr:23907_t:CDS:2 [Dentiscutata erythropus]
MNEQEKYLLRGDVQLQYGWGAKVLPNETLTQIFKDLDYPMNCIYVNHSWAFAALPFLWQSPFTTARDPIKLVETLIKSLPADVKNSLQQDVSAIRPWLTEHTCYKYAEWIKELQYEQLLSYVIRWFENRRRIKSVSKNPNTCHSLELRSEGGYLSKETRFQIQSIFSALISFLISSSRSLRTLDLSTKYGYPHLSTMLSPMRTNCESLIAVTELTCDTWVPENFYYTLSLRSHNLESLYIYHPQRDSDVIDLALLIKHQTGGIQHIKLSDSGAKITMLLESFGTQATTLSTLKLHRTNLTSKGLDALGKLVNLKSLELDMCRFLLCYPYIAPDPLWPKLKRLHLSETEDFVDVSAITVIITKVLSSLDELLLHHHLRHNDIIRKTVINQLPNVRRHDISNWVFTKANKANA